MEFDVIIWGAIVVGLTEVVKRASGMNTRYVPIAALIITFSILGAYNLIENTAVTSASFIEGFVIALTSVGLFSGVRSTLK